MSWGHGRSKAVSDKIFYCYVSRAQTNKTFIELKQSHSYTYTHIYEKCKQVMFTELETSMVKYNFEKDPS